MRIGAGYNPWLFGPGSTLELARPVSLVEGGLAELPTLCHERLKRPFEISLHLARTPITEDADEQDAFVSFIKGAIKGAQPLSVGLHLTGPRHEGIGRYGFSSHYLASDDAEERAIRFVGAMSATLGVPVWLENANFYSPSPLEAVRAWESYSRILDRTGALAIVDLPHLIIDATNSGIEPRSMIGCVPWDRVAEVHLSGIVTGKDGALHDGHSAAVSSMAWTLTEELLGAGLLDPEAVWFTIEHTDPSWGERGASYLEDFSRLERTLRETRARPTHGASRKADGYARAFLTKILSRRLPRLVQACEQRGVAFPVLVDRWIDRVSVSRRILLTRDEVPELDSRKHALAAEEFLAFSKEYFSNEARS